MTRRESKILKQLKHNMLNTLFECFNLPNLSEQDRQILCDTIRELMDERTPYDTRMRAFTKRNYIIQGITHKYATTPSYNKSDGSFSMFDYDDMPF